MINLFYEIMCYQAFNSFHLELKTLAPTLIKPFKMAERSEGKNRNDLKKRTCPFFLFCKRKKRQKNGSNLAHFLLLKQI